MRAGRGAWATVAARIVVVRLGAAGLGAAGLGAAGLGAAGLALTPGCAVYDRTEFRNRLDARRLEGEAGEAGPSDASPTGDSNADGTPLGDTAPTDAPPIDAAGGDTVAPDSAPSDDTAGTDAVSIDVAHGDAPDVFVPPGTCRVDADCDDRIACNGSERCLDGRCRAGAAVPCPLPTSPCSMARCDTTAGGCVTVPTDADGDGVPARSVVGIACAGTDCDDSNPMISPMAVESCDGVDNNCNMLVDEGLSCGVTNDSCTAAQRVTLIAGSTSTPVSGSTLRATPDTRSACFGSAADVWYSVQYPANLELTIEAPGARLGSGIDPTIAVRSSCDASAFEACHRDVSGSDRTSRVWVRSDPGTAGNRTILVGVSTGTAGAFTLQFTLGAAVSSSSCASPFNLVSGGTALGWLTTATRGGSTAPCDPSRSDGPEQVYTVSAPASGSMLVFRASTITAVYSRAATCTTMVGAACDSSTSFVTPISSTLPFFTFVDSPSLAIGVRPYTLEYRRP